MNFQPFKIRKYSIILILVMSVSSFTVTEQVQAHDYYKIKLEVQVVNPASMNDTAIKDNVNKMNDIFKACRIKFNVIKIVRNVEGSADNITARGELRGKMKLDLKGDPFKGSGAGITVTPSVDGNGNTNGMTLQGDPTSEIVKDGSVGETWAHEMAHGMGLGHGGKDTNGDGKDDKWDPDGDGNPDTAADKANTMWPIRSERTGNTFSETNCKKLNEAANKIGQGVLNAEQTAVAPDNDSYIGKLFDYIVDKVKESPVGKLADLIYGTVSAVEPFLNLTMKYVIEGVFSQIETVDLSFQMGFDADNNPSTGTTWANVPGIDKVIEVWLEGGTFYDSNIWPHLYDNVIFENSRDLPAIVNKGLMNESSQEFESPTTINQTARYSFVELTINMTDLGAVLPAVPAVMVVNDWIGGTEDSVNFTLHTQPIDEPKITVDKMQVWNGYQLNVIGQHFTPNSNADFVMGDKYIKTVAVDGNGDFEASLLVEDFDLGTYYLEVVDSEGYLGIMIIDLIDDPNPEITDSSSNISSTSATSSGTSSMSDLTGTTSTSDDESSSDDGIDFPLFGLITGVLVLILGLRKLSNKNRSILN